MSTNIPSTYDMLSIYGVLPYDVNQYLTDKPSDYLSQAKSGINPNLKSDVFNKSGKKPLDAKKVGFAALGTYIAGAILSKSKNPVKGAKAIGNLALNILKFPIKLLKK
ncbi:MAG: hypothetical protein PHV37_04130 [Candidatus Gastranaerophilales bacterium]|nr:hypothetical protein [Candidatus Gastranaerophilales bacterium]